MPPLYPNFPISPSPGNLPGAAEFPSTPLMPGAKPQSSVGATFNKMFAEISTDIAKPQQLSQEMISGKRKFDSAELVYSILEAERKLTVTVRVINDLVKGIKQLEAISA